MTSYPRYLSRWRVTLLAVTAIAVCSTAAATASAALPEFVGATPQNFASKLKASTLETVGGLKITCTAGTDAGTVTGPKALMVTVKLTGCMLNGLICGSGRVAGEIETFPLSGTLGYINKAKKQVGLDLAQPAGAVFATFTCNETLHVTVRGSVIGRITPINKVLAPPKHFTVKFTQTTGVQAPMNLEGGPVDILETSLGGGPFEQTGLATVDQLSFGAPLEVVA